jgi:DNA-binding transcriptional LysR family regulator
VYRQISAIDLNGLALFHELANSASLRQAATRLGVPQATVSRKLRELEQDLGAVLFKRGPRRLSLTEAGQTLLEHSEHIITEVSEACNAVAEIQSEPRGTIRVSLPFGFGTDLASSAIAKFAIAYPHVELNIMATHRPVDVTTEPIDVALNVGPVLNESLPAVKLSELHRGVYASTRYCERQGVPTKPADLARFECITLESQRASGLWSFGTGKRRSPVHSRIQVTDVATAFQMVCADLGFAILPNILCIEALRTGKVQRVLQGWSIPPLPVTATYLDRRNLPLRIRAFLDFIRDELRPLTKLP